MMVFSEKNSADKSVVAMGFKVTPTITPETTLKEPKAGNEIKNQFWLTNSPKSEDQPPKRSEANVSRQFQPKKKHGISEAWSKKMQESVRFSSFAFSLSEVKVLCE